MAILGIVLAVIAGWTGVALMIVAALVRGRRRMLGTQREAANAIPVSTIPLDPFGEDSAEAEVEVLEGLEAQVADVAIDTEGAAQPQ